MTKPTTSQTWVGVAMAALTLVTTYLGYDKYEQVQAGKGEPATVTVNVESMPDSASAHSHAAVVSRDVIKGLIREMVSAQHEKNLKTFKRLESWETNSQ